MTTTSFDRYTLLGVAPILVAGAVVLPTAAIFGGPTAAVVAACGVCATFAIYVVAESVAKFSRIERPLERMLLTMGVRGMLAATAVLAAMAIDGIEPKVVALVAVPLYLSLITGEAISATITSATKSSTMLGQPKLKSASGARN
jgi:hypothetical protein